MTQKKGILKRKEPEKNIKKEKAEYIFKVLDSDLKDKALLAAEAQVYKLKKDGLMEEPILLQLSTLLPTCTEKEFTRRIITVPNRLKTVKNTSILLVTKDPVDTYRIPLTEVGVPTADTFTEIIGYKKFKSLVGTSKSALKTYHEYDMIITDNRLHSLLPKLLGPTIFCKSSQKFPLMLQMATQSPDAELVKSKKSQKMKDERVEPEYVQSQIRSWCKNTTFVPSTGPSLSIIVGYPKMTGAQIVENIDAVLAYLTDKKFKPIGGLIVNGIDEIVDIYLRANDKSVPVMRKDDRFS